MSCPAVNIFIDDTLDLQDSINPTASCSLQVPISTSNKAQFKDNLTFLLEV